MAQLDPYSGLPFLHVDYQSVQEDMKHFHALKNSRRDAVPGASLYEVDLDQLVTLSLELRRGPKRFQSTERIIGRDEFAKMHGAEEADVERVQVFARSNRLQISEVKPAARLIRITGKLGDLVKMFPAEVRTIRSNGSAIRERTGLISVPSELADVVIGVHGYDQRPVVRPLFKTNPTSDAYSPLKIGQIYEFPQGDGTGATVAILEFGGGYRLSDLTDSLASVGITTQPVITSVSVRDAQNNPGSDPDSDIEVALDIQTINQNVPGAPLVVYFAPNSSAGFIDALADSVHANPTPTAISISWGGDEKTWGKSTVDAMDRYFQDAAKLGVSVTVSAGDSGSADNTGALVTDYPASNPNVLACGGTNLTVGSGGAPSESVWNANGAGSGGGISVLFGLPVYQSGFNVPNNPNGNLGRGVPDVSADADPATGYSIIVNGAPMSVGGTSAVAPLYASLLARIAGANLLGHVNPTLYTNPAAFNDITQGNNDALGNAAGMYQARAGWDACTGLGTPRGSQIAALLRPTLTPRN